MASAELGWACDTSVSVASLDPTHRAHAVCRQALLDRRPALAGHAAFETYSVLTRLPVPLRLSGPQATEVLAAAFPEPCWLDQRSTGELLTQLGALNLVGGSVYDALVGWAARTARRRLLTRDGRAERTYRLLGVDHELLV